SATVLRAARFVAPSIGRGGVTTTPPRHHIRHPTTTLCNGACAPFVLGWALKEPQPPAMIGTCLNLLTATAPTDSARPSAGRPSNHASLLLFPRAPRSSSAR